jgi:hypothetical protein
MVFGNAQTIRDLMRSSEQVEIYAMRASRSISLDEVTRVTGLSLDEVRRYNPALVRQVPAGANLYLPFLVEEFGPDVSFWHRPPSSEFASVLNEFLQIGGLPEDWDDRSLEPVLIDFQQRFEATNSEEGAVMTVVLGYYMDDAYRSRRAEILAEFRTSERIKTLFEQGLLEHEAVR